MKKHQTAQETSFRILLEHTIAGITKRRATWPPVFGALLDRDFQAARDEDLCYTGNVFIDRNNHKYESNDEKEREERQVSKLFHKCWSENRGCLEMGQEKFLLLGYHWPNQGNHRSRCADLVGLDVDGGLVVFEAKMPGGTHALSGVVEGLDYLACLMRSKNFVSILRDFERWSGKYREAIDSDFQEVAPKNNVNPTLILMAPTAYFARQSRSARGKEWLDMANAKDWIPSVRVLFAITDFTSTAIQQITKDPNPKGKR